MFGEWEDVTIFAQLHWTGRERKEPHLRSLVNKTKTRCKKQSPRRLLCQRQMGHAASADVRHDPADCSCLSAASRNQYTLNHHRSFQRQHQQQQEQITMGTWFDEVWKPRELRNHLNDKTNYFRGLQHAAKIGDNYPARSVNGAPHASTCRETRADPPCPERLASGPLASLVFVKPAVC